MFVPEGSELTAIGKGIEIDDESEAAPGKRDAGRQLKANATAQTPAVGRVSRIELKDMERFLPGQSVSSRNYRNLDQDGEITIRVKRGKNPDDPDAYEIKGLNIFTKLRFYTKNCTIVLRGCMSGNGDSGRALLKTIAAKTGYKTAGFTRCTVNGRGPCGLAGMHPNEGYGTEPDIVVYPQKYEQWTGDFP